MKKFVSLLLVIVLTVSFVGASAFADTDSPDLMQQLPEQDDSQSQESSSEQEVMPEFIGGAFVNATIPQSMVVEETVGFYVSIQNFINGAAYDLTGLTVLITGASTESFELLPFYRTSEGLVYFTVKAKDICPLQSFSVVVTDGTHYSLPFVFQTSVIEAPVETPASEEEASSDGESEPESESEASSSSASNGEESSNREPDSSRETSSQQDNVAGQESSTGNSGDGVSGENGENSNTPEEEEDPDDGDDEQQMPEIMYPQENPADMFTPRAAALRVPQITEDAESAPESGKIVTGLTDGPAWSPQSGIPDRPKEGATISSTTPLVFAIPTDNFVLATGGVTDTIDTNINDIIDKNQGVYRDKVKVIDTGVDKTDRFSIEFVKIAVTGGHAYAVKLTPDKVTGETKLAKGTTFGFDGQTNRYALTKDLMIVPEKSSSKATGLNGYSLRSDYTWWTKNGSPAGDGAIDAASAGDEFLIRFSPQFFDWDGDMPATVTLSSIRSNISLKQTGKNSRVFEKIELTSVKGEAAVRIKFKDVIPRTRELEYSVTLYLAVKGSRDEDTELQIDGTLGDEDPDEFYSEDQDIDISDGRVGKAMENIRNARVDIGEGVTVNVPVLRKGLRFFGVAVTGPEDDRDEELLNEYPDIVEIYTLYTLGLNGAESTVDIDTFTGYYIYDSDLRYLGEQLNYISPSNNYYLAAKLGNKPKNLPFSNKYYLAAKLLDVPYEEEDDDWPPEFEDYPSDFFPENENANPATGK